MYIYAKASILDIICIFLLLLLLLMDRKNIYSIPYIFYNEWMKEYSIGFGIHINFYIIFIYLISFVIL